MNYFRLVVALMMTCGVLAIVLGALVAIRDALNVYRASMDREDDGDEI